MTEAEFVVDRQPPRVQKYMRAVEELAERTNSPADRADRWGDGTWTRIVAEPGQPARIELYELPNHDPVFTAAPAQPEKKSRWRWRRT